VDEELGTFRYIGGMAAFEVQTLTIPVSGTALFWQNRVHFTVDIRSWDDDHALKAREVVRKDFEDIAARRGCPIKIEETWRVEHSPFDEKLVQGILNAAEDLGYSSLHMVSGAGHDASYMNQITATAMLFVPSLDGRSHVEVENTSWKDCEAGANVLLHCMLKSANETG